MELAAPLPLARVHVVNGRLAIDWLTIDDETTVRLAGERGDPVRFVVEAIEIGARVLDREQTEANAEVVRAEFEKTARALHGFQTAHLAATRQIAGQQSEQMRAMNEKLERMNLEIAQLRAEKEKLAELAAVEEKGTAKGRTYEEAVADALEAIAAARGDHCDAVGDLRGEGGRKGDIVVAVDACSGAARGKIVFEAKNSQLSKNRALAELDGALETRAADYAVLVVPSEGRLPARTHPLRELNGDKLFVTYDPEDGSTLALEVGYALARARVLMARAGARRGDRR